MKITIERDGKPAKTITVKDDPARLAANLEVTRAAIAQYEADKALSPEEAWARLKALMAGLESG